MLYRFQFSSILITTGLVMSLLNLMAMATDHFIATVHPFSHLYLLRGCRANLIIAALWFSGVLMGFSDFISPLFEKYWKYKAKYNYCAFTHETPYQEEYIVFIVMFVCLLSMLCVYTRVYCEVRKHQSRRQHSNTASVIRHRKALLTTLLVLGTFIVCWMPICIFEITLIFQVLRDKLSLFPLLCAYIKAKDYLHDLLLLNSLMDPLIYAIRLKDVRFGFLKLLAKCRCIKGKKNMLKDSRIHRYKYTASNRWAIQRSINGSNQSTECNNIVSIL